MKKIIFSLFVLCLFDIFIGNRNVYAQNDISKTLVVVSSNDESYDFKYDGYEIISNTVNTKVPGEYFIVYRNYLNKEQVIKKVIVVDKVDIDKKHYTLKEEKELLNNTENIIFKHIISDNKIIVITKEVISNNLDEIEKSNYFVSLIENGKEIFVSELMTECFGEIICIKIYNNDIYVLGSRFFVIGLNEFFVARYDFSGNMINIKYYGGNLNETPKSIEFIDNYVYVVGDTVSERGEVCTNNTGSDTFIFKMDINNKLKMSDVKILGEEGNDTCYGSFVYNGFIYMIKHYILNDIKYPTIKLLKLDKELNLISEKILDYGFNHNILGIKLENNEILITRTKDDDTTSEQVLYVDEVSESLNKKNIFKINLSSDFYIYDSYLQHNYLSILFNNNGTSSTNIYIYNLINNTLIEKLNYGYLLNNVELLDERTIVEKNNKLTKHILSSIYVSSFGSSQILNKDDQINNYEIYINNQKYKLNLDKSKIYYDTNLFGKYKCTYYFNTDKYDLMYHHDINVLSNLSLLNNTTYDLNLLITFNGKGILNNTEIQNGYVVDKPGDYHLKIYGKDDKTIEVKFKVEDLSINVSEKITDDLTTNKTDIKNNLMIDSKNNTHESSVFLETDSKKPQKKVVYWPVLFPTSLIVIFSFFIIKGVR